MFGGATQPSSNPFGQSTQQRPTSSIFGQSTQQLQPSFSSVFGPSTAQQPQQQQAPVINLLNQSTAASQPSFGGSILGQSVVQPLPRLGQSGLGDSQWRPHGLLQPRKLLGLRSTLWPGRMLHSMYLPDSNHAAGEKPVPEQIELLAKKWIPTDPDCSFQTYLYNQVAPDTAQFYHPAPGEDERKWEEALQKKPDANSIPINIRGFEQLGHRMKMQDLTLSALRTRMHEINDSLNALREKHELQLSVRAQKARERHVALSRRVLRLAGTVQVLRNRGYALDGVEEGLKKQLENIASKAFSPVLAGRQEEVWARLVVLRERANMMQEELKKISVPADGAPVLDEEKLEKVRKVSSLFILFYGLGSQLCRSLQTTRLNLNTSRRRSATSRRTLRLGKRRRYLLVMVLCARRGQGVSLLAVMH